MLVRCPSVKFTMTIAMTLAIASCSEKTDRRVAKTPSPPAATVVVAVPPAAADAGPSVTIDPKRIAGDPSALAFLEDGTLAIATDKELVLVEPAGATRRTELRGRTAKLDRDPASQGIVLEGASDVVLLETPTLRELYSGPGSVVLGPLPAIATAGAAPAVLAQLGGKLTRFTLPPGKAKRVDRIELVAAGKSALVTWSIEDAMEADAAIFDASTGRLIGRVPPMPTFSVQPVAAVAGDVEIAIEKGKVVVIDLTTAAVLRSAKVACPKDQFLGNPTTVQGADLVLVTCGGDGIALDAKTLAPKRRYSRIMPGCDNGEVLPAHFDAKTRTELVVEGCGGIARLDLATGKYRCSDEIGLVGAEYQMVPTGTARQAPPGRENLPRCTKDDEAGSMHVAASANGTFAIVYGEDGAPAVLHAGGKIALDGGASAFAFSKDETKLAYALKDRVIVRSLPDGATVREISSR